MSPSMSGSYAYDVIVIGLGGMGSAAAYHLAARGQRVLGLEQFGPAHGHGSSHGGYRVIRQAPPEEQHVPLSLRASELWTQLERDTGRELVTVTGGLMLGAEQGRLIAGSRQAAQSWGLAHEMLDARQIRRRFRTLTPATDVVGFYEGSAGVVRPEAGVAAHLQRAEREGAQLHFHERVTQWFPDESGEGVRVVTDDDTYTAARLVLCAGAWAPDMLAGAGLSLRTRRYVRYWFEPVVGLRPYHPSRHPVFAWEAGDGRELWGYPAHPGRDAGVEVSFLGGESSRTPLTIDRAVRPREVEIMRGYLRPRTPTLPGTLVDVSTCVYSSAPGGNVVLAAHPQYPQVTVGCGCSAHGFAFVPVAGEILADLAVDGSSRHPVDLFDPQRQLAPAV